MRMYLTVCVVGVLGLSSIVIAQNRRDRGRNQRGMGRTSCQGRCLKKATSTQPTNYETERTADSKGRRFRGCFAADTSQNPRHASSEGVPAGFRSCGGRGAGGQFKHKTAHMDQRGGGHGTGGEFRGGRQGTNMAVRGAPSTQPEQTIGRNDEVVADESLRQALNEAVVDEYRSQLYYEKAMERFGSSRRFENLARAESRHTEALLSLFARYQLEPPPRDALDVSKMPDTLKATIELAIRHETANVDMYDQFLKLNYPQDVRIVFQHLRDASASHHLPALRRGM